MSYASSEEESRRVVHAVGGQGRQRCSWSTHHGRSVSRTGAVKDGIFLRQPKWQAAAILKVRSLSAPKTFCQGQLGRFLFGHIHLFPFAQAIWLRFWDRYGRIANTIWYKRLCPRASQLRV